MNGSRLKLQPDLLIQYWYVLTGILACYWCGLLISPRQYVTPAGIHVLVTAIGISLAVSGWFWGRALADGARVLGAMQAPNRLWRDWLRGVLTALCLQWGAAILAGALALSLLHTSLAWSFAAALYSVILLLSLIGALSYFGVWHWAWQWGIVLSACLAGLFYGFHTMAHLLQISVAGNLAIATGIPIFTAWLGLRWYKQPPKGVALRRRVQFNLWQRLVSHTKRYTVLLRATQRTDPSKNKPYAAFFLTIFPVAYMMFLRALLLKGTWGNSANILYILTLIVVMVLASTTVVCKDLHWRRVLAPRGFPRGRLGWHIIKSTLSAVMAFALLFAAVISVLLMLFNWAGVGMAPARYLDLALRLRVMPLEFALVICAGVTIRGTRRPALTIFILLFGTCALGLLALLRFKGEALVNFLVIGPAYVAGLLAAIGLTVTIANRVWSTQRLLPYIVADTSANDERVAGGRWFFWPGRPY